MLIDTSYGLTDMPQAIREITALPLLVVNTHGHINHTHGNNLFDTVFLSHLDNRGDLEQACDRILAVEIPT
ncbi:hypothetical protein ASF12_32880 [Paenibacillus sp. Leaf72]|nr:hypothetical protein ASF12_32880 [Paenibacillus sp. Leaf72]